MSNGALVLDTTVLSASVSEIVAVNAVPSIGGAGSVPVAIKPVESTARLRMPTWLRVHVGTWQGYWVTVLGGYRGEHDPLAVVLNL